MNEPNVGIVVFDLGGVLVRICRSWREGCAAAGVPVRDGSDSPEAVERRRSLSAAYQEGRLTCDEFFEGVSRSTGGLYSAGEVRRIHDAWLLGPYEGTESLVGDLRSAGVTTGVLSNTNHRHWRRMCEAYGAVRGADHPHASHLLGVAKPSGEIYRLFEQRTGMAPERILFFDDLEENVAAAVGAGWRAHRVDYTGDTAAQMLDVLREQGVL